ncbi:unnamed protein product [Brachionus calyciflorus]|uniref:BEN domain-containing protein n=1 Tax=Brachionus calyciflorus TaxID=104777 RepID=A0A813RBU1_9BILA|nr:unnamed protein product [Brachionus calyciflorus]
MSVSPNYEARLNANQTPTTISVATKIDDEIDDTDKQIYQNSRRLNTLKSNETSQLHKNKLSCSSLNSNSTKILEFDDDLDESLEEDFTEQENKLYFSKKLKKSLHPKKNLIFLSTLDEENSKNENNKNLLTIQEQQNSPMANKRRKLSSISDHETLSNISDEMQEMEQVVNDDTKLTFKNCLLKTMNEILRTNLQLSRKVDHIRENQYQINKRLRYLESVLKTRNVKDQEIEEDIDRLSDLTEENQLNQTKSSDELRPEIKQEKVVNEPKAIQNQKPPTPKDIALNNQSLGSSSRRICDTNQVQKQQEFMRQSYRPSHYMHHNNQPQFNFNYNGHHHGGQSQGHHDAYSQFQYRYHGGLSVGVPNGVSNGPHSAGSGVPSYRPNTAHFMSPGSNQPAQNKTAAALAAAVAAAMAQAQNNQVEYSQENSEENEYDDSIEDENSPYSQNQTDLNNHLTPGTFSSIVPQHAPIRHIPSSIVDQLELSEDVERLVSRDIIKRCIRKAKHRGNFAANLAAELFTKEERITCNCTGTRGKRQLSPKRLQIVKEITYRMYNSQAVQAASLSGGQQSAAALLQDFEEAWRKECITAIDAKNRSIGRDLIKNTNPQFGTNQQSISPSISSTTNNSNSNPVVNEVF